MTSFARKVALGATLAMAAAVATPASAAITPVDPCSAGYVQGAIACVGYVGGNLFTGSAGSSTSSTQQQLINQLLNGPATNNTPAYTPPYALNTGTVLGSLVNLNGTATLNFGSLNLSGLTVLGAHFGNNIDSDVNNVSAFWLLNVTNPTNTITLANGAGSSNAQIFATNSAVPEPGTWALMLIGFGGMGVAMRRSRQSGAALTQMA